MYFLFLYWGIRQVIQMLLVLLILYYLYGLLIEIWYILNLKHFGLYWIYSLYMMILSNQNEVRSLSFCFFLIFIYYIIVFFILLDLSNTIYRLFYHYFSISKYINYHCGRQGCHKIYRQCIIRIVSSSTKRYTILQTSYRID